MEVHQLDYDHRGRRSFWDIEDRRADEIIKEHKQRHEEERRTHPDVFDDLLKDLFKKQNSSTASLDHPESPSRDQLIQMDRMTQSTQSAWSETSKESMVVDRAKKFCQEGGHKLLYLVKFGSHLYGTDTEDSDLDIYGVFVPSVESLALQRSPKALQMSSGDKDGKNTKDDFDLTLYSLQYWLLNKVRTMEINALDLLFSSSNEACVIFKDPAMDAIFDNKDRLLTFGETDNLAYVRYAHRQSKKYGLKGTMVGVLKRISEYLDTIRLEDYPRLVDVAPNIIQVLGGPSDRVHSESKDGLDFLVVNGKMHQHTTSIIEFKTRIKHDYERYGARARQAERNEGIDWKACSHALRAVYQMSELFGTGDIKFPLSRNRDTLLRVKKGAVSWEAVEDMILSGIESLETIPRSPKLSTYKYDKTFVEKTILDLTLGAR